ncbi:MAG TPA: hypothetical protein DCX54_07395, partial [Flavobacteriales bacterium]|nr:hypothetical protein [Flavobacteriales bacterium]
MDENAQGGKTYSRIIQSARASNEPIGPHHHVHDKHVKQWEKLQASKVKDKPEPVESKAESKPKTKLISKEKSKAVIEKAKAASAVVKTVAPTKTKETIEAERTEQLREKLRQLQKKKLA